jgi:PAS domain S-box-containing protein
MPGGVVVLDASSGDIILANRQAEELLEIPATGARASREWVGLRMFRPDGRRCRREDQPLRRAIQTGETSEEEVLLQRSDGSFRTLLVRATCARDQRGEPLAAVATYYDISTRKQMEDGLRKAREELEERVQERTTALKRANERLREDEALLERIFDTTHMLMAYLDPEFNFIRVNRAYAEADERPMDFFPGRNHFDLYPDSENEALFRDVVQTGRPHFAYARPFQYPDHPGRGDTYWDWSLQPVRNDDGRVEGLLLCILNVTQRVQAEREIREYQEKLRELASELSLAEERERRRIAARLHDYVSQTLALGKIKLGALQQSVSDPATEDAFADVREHLSEAIRYSRSLTFDLSPPILYEMGLEAALRSLTERTAQEHGIEMQFQGDGRSMPLGDDLRVVLFQSARELITNVVKHSGAAPAQVSVRQEGEEVRVRVADEGRGCDLNRLDAESREEGGFGLFNIRERMDRLGGRLDLWSERGKGMTATLVIPVPRTQRQM